jgi:S-adenosylmethionine:tRNA ribosyltransferase-isomerase
VKTSEFDYDLPSDRVAQTPVEPRDFSRLMVVHRGTGQFEHRLFRDIGEYLRPGDLMVLNQTRVIPARLFGHKAETSGKVELLLLAQSDEYTWEALVRGKGLRPGTRIELQPAGGRQQAASLAAEIIAETGAGGRLVHFERPIEAALDDFGAVPLPPYIHEPLADPERYQTVYGRVEGSVAASTAGLHFTPELLVGLRHMGVEMAFVTLHNGLDTFRPVKEERVEDHQIHTEWFELTAQVAGQINRARLEGRRVIAVGTTVVRALESAANASTMSSEDARFQDRPFQGVPAANDCVPEGEICAWRTVSAFAGPTGLFIYPGYRFRVIETLVTNFHLPRSSLLMLVSAFAGGDLILRAYQEAIQKEYRFFSFGDAMLLL